MNVAELIRMHVAEHVHKCAIIDAATGRKLRTRESITVEDCLVFW